MNWAVRTKKSPAALLTMKSWGKISNICSSLVRGAPSKSCVYPKECNVCHETSTSLGEKWVIGTSLISKRTVPSRKTGSSCFARSNPFSIASGVWSLLAIFFIHFTCRGILSIPRRIRASSIIVSKRTVCNSPLRRRLEFSSSFILVRPPHGSPTLSMPSGSTSL